MGIQHVSSKLRKTAVLMADSRVRPYVPVTYKLTSARLNSMLNRFGMVYVKPDCGQHGDGVMRVEKEKAAVVRKFSFHIGSRRRSFVSYKTMYTALMAARSSRRLHLVQKGIQLRRFKGRRYDIRVMVQRNLNHKWETTGMLARVAHPARVVTNCLNGGKVESFERIFSGRSRITMRRKLNQLGRVSAAAMHRRFRKIQEIGLDVGLDMAMKPWIIEVNTSPDPFLFNQLKDKRAFRQIYRYAVAYGKYAPKRRVRNTRRRK